MFGFGAIFTAASFTAAPTAAATATAASLLDPPVTLGFLQNIGPVGLVFILVIALLIFGNRLPEVARSMGKGIVEFKKGLRGVEDEIDQASNAPPPAPPPAQAAPPPASQGAPQAQQETHQPRD